MSLGKAILIVAADIVGSPSVAILPRTVLLSKEVFVMAHSPVSTATCTAGAVDFGYKPPTVHHKFETTGISAVANDICRSGQVVSVEQTKN